MAGDEDGYGVGPAAGCGGADGGGAADASGKLSVGQRGAVRNGKQGSPHGLLKRGAGREEGYAFEAGVAAGEVGVEPGCGAVENRRGAPGE